MNFQSTMFFILQVQIIAELEEDDVVLVQEMLCDNNDADKEYHEKTGPQMCQVWDVADEDIDSDFSNFHKHSPSVHVNPLQGLHERVNCIICWIFLFLCLWSSFCVISDNALEILLEFLRALFESMATIVPVIGSFATAFPKSLHLL